MVLALQRDEFASEISCQPNGGTHRIVGRYHPHVIALSLSSSHLGENRVNPLSIERRKQQLSLLIDMEEVSRLHSPR